MNLEEIRRRIDQLDRELLVLLQERMGLALRTRKFKGTVADPRREQDVLARAERMNLDLIKGSFARQLLEHIIRESRRLQGEERRLVAFQGEHGAYGEIASRRLVPGSATIPCREFVDVFQGVERGDLDLGVVPVENSLEGAVTPVNDLLTTTGLMISGEVRVPVRHCLLAAEKVALGELRTVYSHPQALAQCQRFLRAHHLEPRPYYDTAGAAKMIARENMHSAAAIGSALCAELYDLELIAQGIEDGPGNSTRFVLLSREPFAGQGAKTSILFTTAHEAGQLFGVLRLFAEAGINLTRIASMPVRSDPGRYSFFLDFEGDAQDPRVAPVMERLDRQAPGFRCLGSYPAHGAEG
jgi:prephenate dehydratase